MAQPYREKPNTIPWPPLVYSAAMVLAWLLERYDAFEVLDHALAVLPRWSGLAVFGAGVAVDVWAFLTLRASKTTVLPNATSTALVTSGPYRFTRNPIYLGNTVALLGFAIGLRWGWLLLLLPVTVAAVNWLAISREEEHLRLRFADEWKSYSSRVRRWL